ncbi:uncharacterized protein LOC8070559 isoform X2 [Sorghum bicolor]|nr:uncharacterized protein LOC8070559 isoform X2 [Sorghum bicolor]|eukprot:XP_021314228.1 uncharacterized protein LOC8070559 isoform X2 [Sorghum bicolor]
MFTPQDEHTGRSRGEQSSSRRLRRFGDGIDSRQLGDGLPRERGAAASASSSAATGARGGRLAALLGGVARVGSSSRGRGAQREGGGIQQAPSENYMALQPWSNNGHRNSPSNSLAGGVPGPMHLLPSQEELAVRCEEIRRIAADNTLVLEDILGLRQELAVIEDDIMLTKQTIPRLRLDNEMEYRDIIQGGMQLEEQMRALKPIKAEVLLLSSEKMELEALCKELSVKVQSLYRELEQIRSENKQIPAIREGLHDIQEEILRASSFPGWSMSMRNTQKSSFLNRIRL